MSTGTTWNDVDVRLTTHDTDIKSKLNQMDVVDNTNIATAISNRGIACTPQESSQSMASKIGLIKDIGEFFEDRNSVV